MIIYLLHYIFQGQLKQRVTSFYIYCDITPPPSTSEDNKSDQLTPRKKKTFINCFIISKDRLLRSF